MSLKPRNDLLGLLARHPVAANLMMAMMIIAGIWGLSKLNAQFFPNFDIDFVSVKVVWVGASAEDIEKLITEPLEQQLRGVDRAKELRSRSVDGLSLVTLEFKEGTDMGLAVDQVKEQEQQVPNQIIGVFELSGQQPLFAIVGSADQPGVNQRSALGVVAFNRSMGCHDQK